MGIRIVLLVLTLAVSPVLLAFEPAEEFPAAWSCRAQDPAWPDRLCRSVCQYYDGTRERNQVQWHCQGSSILNNCTVSFCRTQEECDEYGVSYTPCHDIEEWVCEARAVRATQFACEVRGPRLSAVKNGDCVLRIVKIPAYPEIGTEARVELRQNCWDPSDYAFAPEWWEPIHPETLQP